MTVGDGSAAPQRLASFPAPRRRRPRPGRLHCWTLAGRGPKRVARDADDHRASQAQWARREIDESRLNSETQSRTVALKLQAGTFKLGTAPGPVMGSELDSPDHDG